jgi:hypothetical protein
MVVAHSAGTWEARLISMGAACTSRRWRIPNALDSPMFDKRGRQVRITCMLEKLHDSLERVPSGNLGTDCG